jgi:hypothetical protein
MFAAFKKFYRARGFGGVLRIVSRETSSFLVQKTLFRGVFLFLS